MATLKQRLAMIDALTRLMENPVIPLNSGTLTVATDSFAREVHAIIAEGSAQIGLRGTYTPSGTPFRDCAGYGTVCLAWSADDDTGWTVLTAWAGTPLTCVHRARAA